MHKTAYEMRIIGRSSDVCSSDLLDFGCTATGHKGQHTCARIDTQVAAGGGLVRLHGNDFGQGMAHISDWNALFLIDFLFERKQHQHMRDGFSYLVYEIGRESGRERVCQYG